MLHPLECEKHTEMTKMTTENTENQIEIYYRSRKSFSGIGRWTQPTVDTLDITHIALPLFVSDQLTLDDRLIFDSQDDNDILEDIYGTMNCFRGNPLSVGHVAGGHQDWMEEIGIGHTSMSIFDVVRINETYYSCQPSGWEALN